MRTKNVGQRKRRVQKINSRLLSFPARAIPPQGTQADGLYPNRLDR
jgi:hypothetical protein